MGPLTARSAPSSALAVASAVGLGGLATISPAAVGAVGSAAALLALPWAVAFIVLLSSASVAGWSYEVAGLTFRPSGAVALVMLLHVLIRAPVRRAWGSTEWFLIVLITANVISSLAFAAVPIQSLRAAALLAFGAAAFFAVSASIRSLDGLRRAVRLLLAASVAVAASGIVALVLWRLTGSTWGLEAGKPRGLAFEPNLYGSTCAFGGIFLLALLRFSPHVVWRWVAWLGATVCAIGLVASLARGAWLGFIAGLLATAAGSVRRARMPRWILVAAACLLVGTTLLVLPHLTTGVEPSGLNPSARAAVLLDFGSGTARQRLLSQQQGINDLMATPQSLLLGLGTGSFGQRHPFVYPDGTAVVIDGEVVPGYLGNLAIRTLYDTGVVGLLTLLAFFASLALPPLRFEGPASAIGRALSAGWTALLVAYLVTDSMLLVWPWVSLGVLRAAGRLATLEGAWRREPHAAEASSRPD